MSEELPREIFSYYGEGREAGRPDAGSARLEYARTLDLLKRYLPRAPAVVIDVGGGPGTYAMPLARDGYEVHLIDAMSLHVEQAKEASARQPEHPLASAEVDDARNLPQGPASADAVLLFGPMYHLTERAGRIAALREAARVLKHGGLLMATAISRFASVLDGLRRGYIDDPEFVALVREDLASGQHRNPGQRPHYFTTAFFHHPGELVAEVEESGFDTPRIVAIEGPGWLLGRFDEMWEDAERRQRLLEAIRWIEDEPSLLGASGHLMAIARKAAVAE